MENSTEEVLKALLEEAICFDFYKPINIENDYELSSKVIEFIRNSSMKHWFELQVATWDRKFVPEFSEVLTKRGMAFAFNIFDSSELLNSNEYVIVNM